VTKYTPRRTISAVGATVAPWQSGYALPQNVKDEPLGRGVLVTKYTPRRTIATRLPADAWLDAPKGLSGMDMNKGSLSSRDNRGVLGSDENGSLGSRGNRGVLGSYGDKGSLSSRGNQGVLGAAEFSPGDPIVAFGRDSARAILNQVKALPVSERKNVLRAVLEGIDPGLWGVVEAKATELKKTKGYGATTALEKAIAISLSNRMLAQLMDLGKGQAPSRGPLSLASPEGLGACHCRTREALGGFFSSITKAATGAISGTAGKIVSTVGSLACKASNSGLLGPAAAIGGSAAGGPAGAQAGQIGAGVASQMCAKAPSGGGGGGGGAYYPPPPAPFPVVPVLIGGGVLLGAIALLTMRRR
jgi:hypothetical protein